MNSEGIASECASKYYKMTNVQKQKLLQFMEDHPKLQKGKYDYSFTMEQARDLWMKLTKILNATQGPKKTWLYWRKSWHDLQTMQRKTGKTTKEILADMERDVEAESKIEYLDVGRLDGSVDQKAPTSSSPAVVSASSSRGAPKLTKNEKLPDNFVLLDHDDNVEHEYYKKKLELMERQTIAFEIQAQSQQIQAETLLEIAETMKDVKEMLKDMNNR